VLDLMERPHPTLTVGDVLVVEDVHSGSIVSTLNLVAAGLGITIVPASLSRLPLEGVTYRPLKGRPALKVPLNLACRADERSAATLGFIDLVRRLRE